MKSPITIVNLILLIGIVAIGFFSFRFIDQPIPKSGNKVVSNSFVSPLELSDMIINQDPELIIIDIRSPQDRRDYTFPNSYHLPDQQFNEALDNGFFNNKFQYVLISNDGYDARKVQHVLSNRGWTNMKVLEGGLTAWFDQVIELKAPSETASEEEIESFLRRKGAAIYFGVKRIPDYPELKEYSSRPIPKKTPAKVTPKKKKKKRMPEGGC